MPQPNTNGAPQAPYTTIVNSAGTNYNTGPFTTIPPEPDIQPENVSLLTTGATGLPTGVAGYARSRRGHAAARPVRSARAQPQRRRLYRRHDAPLLPGVAAAGLQPRQRDQGQSDRLPQRSVPVRHGDLFGARNKSEGNEMGFYNAEQEQASFLKTLADRFTLSDNFHQSFLGGTGANHFMFGTGDAGFWSDGKGNPVTPPADDRQSEPGGGHGQPVHRRQQLQQLLGFHSARRRNRSSIHREPALQRRAELRGRSLLHAGQYQPRLSSRTARCSRRSRARCRPRRCGRSATRSTTRTSPGPISAAPTTMPSFSRTRRSRQTPSSNPQPDRGGARRSGPRARRRPTARSAIRSSMRRRSWATRHSGRRTSRTPPT